MGRSVRAIRESPAQQGQRPWRGWPVSAKKRSNWGGVRPGAGRPKGSGAGPSPNARKNRIAVMLSDAELARLLALAELSGKPVATLAYELIHRGLQGRARRSR